MSVEPVVIDVGACRCPGTPHTTDTVTLAAEPSTPLGLAARAALQTYSTDPVELEVALGAAFMRYGIVGWTFVDEDGDPISVTSAAIARLLPWLRGGQAVADKAGELYAEAIFGPLVRASSKLPRSGPTGDTTSAQTPRSPKPRSSSRSSSPAPTVTVP